MGSFCVGDYRVNPELGEVEGPDRTVRLQPRVMAVLVCLAARQGRVVSRDDLLEQVWGSVVVTDDSLTRCISEIRAALGDKHRPPRLIETIPKVGYRLLAQVLDDDRAEPPARGQNELQFQPWASDNVQVSLVAVIDLGRMERPLSPPATRATRTVRVGNRLTLISSDPEAAGNYLRTLKSVRKAALCCGDVLLDDQRAPGGQVLDHAANLLAKAGPGELVAGNETTHLLGEEVVKRLLPDLVLRKTSGASGSGT